MILQEVNVGILGVGAIGSVVARYMTDNQGVKLIGFNRTAREKTILYFENRRYDIPISIQSESATDQPLDWLVICLKEHHFTAAQPYFSKLIQPTTKLVVIRNGLRLSEPLLPFFDHQNILECQIDCPTERLAEGNFKQLRAAKLMIAKGELSDEFAQLVPEMKVVQVADFKTASWKKLIESAALGAITCLSGETCHIFKNENLVELYQDLVKESIVVARADGARIKMDFADKLIKKLANYPPEKGSSMLTDRQAGRPIELGAKSGIISEIGQEYQVETPLHDLVVNLLQFTNRKGN